MNTRLFIYCLLILIITPQLVSAQAYLNENSTWETNLTAGGWGSLAFVDLDNDTDNDLISTGGGTTIFAKAYTNNGSSLNENLTWETNLTGIVASSLVTGDLNNDGRLDIIITGCISASGVNGICPNDAALAKVYINNGTSLVENSTWENELTPVSWGSIALGDIDNDGRLDMVLTGHAGGGLRHSEVYINNGTVLKKNSVWNNSLIAVDQSSTSLVDLNGDSKLDLILTGQTDTAGAAGRYSNVYINNGTSLTENTTWEQPLLDRAKTSVVVGDFDNDARTDVFIQGFVDSARLYRNNGTSLPLNQSTDSGQFVTLYDGEVAWGDYTNDGRLDLAQNGNEYLALISDNNASYVFTSNTSVSNLLANLGGESSITWNDVDNDGDLDLIQQGSDSGANARAYVYTNNATVKNTAPNASTLFNSSYSDGKLILNWSNASDAETPSLGLYYNMRVGSCSGCQDIVSGVYGGSSNPTAGYFGNMMQRRRLELAVPNIAANQTYFWAVQTIDAGLKAGNWSAEQNITTPSDTTKPVISVNSPTPADGASQSTFTFTVNVTVYDNVNLTNVTLYGSWGGWHANVTNTSGLNNTFYVFNIDLTGYGYGQYAYQILAYDNTSNSNTTANRTLNIPAPSADTSGAGAGGGSSGVGGAGTIKSFSISSEEIKSVVISGETGKQSIEIVNNGTSSINFTAESDSPYFIVRDKEFSLKPNETKSLEILFIAPSDKPGIYTATITIRSGTSIKTVTAIMEVKQKQALFDIKINIPERFRILIPGEEIFAELQLINIGKIGQVDVVINYAIIDASGKVIASATEPIGIEVISSFTKSLQLPADLEPGTYAFAVNATYQGTIASNKQEFRVVAEYSLTDLVKKNIVGIVILFVAIFAVYVAKKAMEKTSESSLKERKFEKKVEREFKELEKKLKTRKHN